MGSEDRAFKRLWVCLIPKPTGSMFFTFGIFWNAWDLEFFFVNNLF